MGLGDGTDRPQWASLAKVEVDSLLDERLPNSVFPTGCRRHRLARRGRRRRGRRHPGGAAAAPPLEPAPGLEVAAE